jgi:alpha-ketoglutarate-dependent taurine dioxygenase
MFYSASAIIYLKDGSPVFSNAILAHLPSIMHPAYSSKTVYTKNTNQIYWENGEVFSAKIINQLIDAHDKNKYLHVWEDHDLVIFDNLRYLHGREENVSTTERKILTRFGHNYMG